MADDLKRNISPEIEEALAEGRAAGLREAAEFIRNVRQKRVSWLYAFMERADEKGWADLRETEKCVLRGVAAAVERLIDGRKAPSHDHIWSLGNDPICAICGNSQITLVAEAVLGG